jgi:Mg2+ and Co2+ transporter CorA
MYEIQNYSLGSNVINEGKNSLTSADQIELNMRKTLADLVQSEVKIIANETQKFIIQYTSMLERLEKHTTTSFDKFSKLCENTLEKKDQAVNHDLNLISKRIIIVGFVVALLTAPIVGSITGYVTAQINKNIFFNTLNNIVKTKNKQ